MSLKHLKSGQDSIESYFYKTALDKNLIDEESGISQAVEQIKKNDLSVSKDLTENVLRLSSALRNRGFVNYANSLEQKLLAFKTSSNAHLYNVHGEEGKDLLDFAHPDGGPEMAQSKDHNGVVETLLEQHKLITDVVKKQPTGKLASKQLINMVKVVLSQDATVPEATKKELSKYWNDANAWLNKALLFFSKNAIDGTIKNIQENYLKDTITTLSRYKDVFLSEGIDKLTNSDILKKLNFHATRYDGVTGYIGKKIIFPDTGTYEVYVDFLKKAIPLVKQMSVIMTTRPTSDSGSEEKAIAQPKELSIEQRVDLYLKEFNEKYNELKERADAALKLLPGSKLTDSDKEKLENWISKTFLSEISRAKDIVEASKFNRDYEERASIISKNISRLDTSKSHLMFVEKKINT